MNPMDMMKNFQNMQSQLGEMQKKLKEVQVTGSAGGDMVQVDMNGHMSVTGIRISPEIVDPEDVDMLQDLVLAACNDAYAKVKETLSGEFSSMFGGLGNLPPGLMGS